MDNEPDPQGPPATREYTLEMECRNCGLIENRQFEWGRQLTSVLMPCNFCGCDTLGFTGKRITVVA